MGEQVEVLNKIPIKWGQQAECVLLVFNLDKSSTEVVHRLGHGAVLVDGVVHLVLGARALLHRGHLLLVALKLDAGVILPHASSAGHRFAAVDVQLCVVLPPVPLGTHLVCVLEHLDTRVRLSEVRSNEPFCARERVVEILLRRIVLVNRSPIMFAQELEKASSLVLPNCCEAA